MSLHFIDLHGTVAASPVWSQFINGYELYSCWVPIMILPKVCRQAVGMYALPNVVYVFPQPISEHPGGPSYILFIA